MNADSSPPGCLCARRATTRANHAASCAVSAYWKFCRPGTAAMRMPSVVDVGVMFRVSGEHDQLNAKFQSPP